MSTQAPARDDLVDVTIRGIASSGAGVGDLPDGRVVFVPRTMPGDQARVRLGKVKARWAEATVESLVVAAEGRVEARCRLFGSCGGCALQHVPYEAQLEWKGRFVADALERIGGHRVEPPVVHPSAQPYGYRNRVTYTLRRLRGGRVVAGFHALGRPAHVIDVGDACALPEPELRTAWASLRAGWGQGARLLPAAGRLRLTLRNGEEGVTLVVEGGAKGWRGTELVQAVEEITAVWHHPADSKRTNLVGGDGTHESWGGERFAVSGQAFLQVNREAAVALEAHVLSLAGSPSRAIDAYAGVGIYGRALARTGAGVTAIELHPEAADAARSGAPKGLEVVTGSVEEQLSVHLPTELLILNPPRTGLDPSIPEAILADPPQQLIYVSCDPATLARDLGRLTPTYEIEDVAAFDLFPQTAHVETVISLRLPPVQ